MASNDATRIFLDVLVDKCRSLWSDLDSLLSRDYPSVAPEILTSCLLEACKRLLGRAIELRDVSQHDEQTTSDEILLEASQINDFLDSTVGVLCPMLRFSSVEEVPSELVLPMERMSRLMFREAQVIVEAVPEMNYFFKEIATDIRNLFSSLDLDDILTQLGFPDELFHLQLCSNPPNGILTHCLLGHEIGHAVYVKESADQRLLPLLSFDEQAMQRFIEASLREITDQVPDNTLGTTLQLTLQESREFLQYVLKAEVSAIAAKWIHEIFCDIIGVGLIGPAYISSSCIFLLAFEDIDYTMRSHPPHRLRIQLALRALERDDPGFGYKRLLGKPSSKDIRSVIKSWKDLVGIRPVRPEDIRWRVVFDAVYSLRNEIIREAKQCLHDNILYPSRFNYEVPKLRRRIRDGLPPNEFQDDSSEQFKIATLQGTLNAGWLCYLIDFPHFIEIHSQFPEEKTKERFYGLVSKGVESSEIQRRWRDIQMGIQQ